MEEDNQINAWECLNKAQAAFKDKKYDRAKHLAEKAIRIYPQYETIAQLLLQDIREAQSKEPGPSSSNSADTLAKSYSSSHVDSSTKKELDKYLKLAEEALQQRNLVAAEKWTQKAKELKSKEPKPSTSGLSRSQSDNSHFINKHNDTENLSNIKTYIKNAEDALLKGNLEDAEMWTKKAQEFRDKTKEGNANSNEENQNENLSESMRNLNISGSYSLPKVTGSADEAQDIINKAYASFENGDLVKAEHFLKKAEDFCPTSEVKVLVEQAREHMKSRDQERLRENVDPRRHDAEPPTGPDEEDDDDICPICQDPCGENRSFTDPCLHRFCFHCICTWCEQKTECPLCKRRITSIRHNIRSDHDHDVFKLDEQRDDRSHGRDADSSQDYWQNTSSDNHQRDPERERLNHEMHDLLNTLSTINLEPLPPLEPLPYLNYPPQFHRARAPRNDFIFSERRNDFLFPERGNDFLFPEPENDFRRSVYEQNLWARPLSDAAGRFRTCTPEFFRGRSDRISRLIPWLSRELNCLINESQVSTVLNKITSLLRRYDVQSAAFEDALRPHLGEDTEHFLHELYVYARCPYSVENYDDKVQYGRRR